MEWRDEVEFFLQNELSVRCRRINVDPYPILELSTERLMVHLPAPPLMVDPDHLTHMSLQAMVDKFELMHLWEDRWKGQKSLMKERFRSMLGKNRRLYARSLSVERLDKSVARSFLEAHHPAGYALSHYHLALCRTDEIYALLSLSKARVLRQENMLRSCEIIRFATRQGWNVVGGFSKLLQHAAAISRAGHLMTYHDLDWGSGPLYRKQGFEQKAIKSSLPFYVDEQFQRHRHAQAGVQQVYNAGSLKWVKIISTPA